MIDRQLILLQKKKWKHFQFEIGNKPEMKLGLRKHRNTIILYIQTFFKYLNNIFFIQNKPSSS
jgi:hypothetical protein